MKAKEEEEEEKEEGRPRRISRELPPDEIRFSQADHVQAAEVGRHASPPPSERSGRGGATLDDERERLSLIMGSEVGAVAAEGSGTYGSMSDTTNGSG